MSVRLTNAIRDHIFHSATADAFAAEHAALKERLHALSQRVYNAFVGEEQVRLMKKVESKFFERSEAMTFVVSDDKGSKSTLKARLPKEVPVPVNTRYGYTLDLTSVALKSEVDDYLAAKKALTAKKEALETSVKEVINSVATVGRLIEVWPESESFVPPSARQAKQNLPAVVTDKLNDMLRSAGKLNLEPAAA